ncbi:hypothetical protein NFI96_014856 [Prochilodus magdalenae]|nr:hypothetical protein NFI96_014856 [Prochilodus magdalenae]
MDSYVPVCDLQCPVSSPGGPKETKPFPDLTVLFNAKCLIMHRWIVGWKRPDLLLFGLCLRALLWICGLDMALGEHSALCNCSKHERITRNYDYMEGGDVRTRRLYSRTQWFLTIDENGNINGTQDPNDCYNYMMGTINTLSGCTNLSKAKLLKQYAGILEIRTVSEGGILAIKGVKSQYYISMSRAGVLQGKKDYGDSCNFKEVFLENFYTAYSSDKWTKNGREMFISLSQKGRPLRGKKTRKESIASHFIPRKCKEDDKTTA